MGGSIESRMARWARLSRKADLGTGAESGRLSEAALLVLALGTAVFGGVGGRALLGAGRWGGGTERRCMLACLGGCDDVLVREGTEWFEATLYTDDEPDARFEKSGRPADVFLCECVEDDSRLGGRSPERSAA